MRGKWIDWEIPNPVCVHRHPKSGSEDCPIPSSDSETFFLPPPTHYDLKQMTEGRWLSCGPRRVLGPAAFRTGDPCPQGAPVPVVVQSLSRVWPFATPGTAALQLPCPSLSPRACSNSCPLSQWCYPTISSSVVPFSSCLQSFPASGSFPMSRLFTSLHQVAKVLELQLQHLSFQWIFRIDWFDLLAVQRTLKSLL